MGANRREFLKGMAGVAAAGVVSPVVFGQENQPTGERVVVS